MLGRLLHAIKSEASPSEARTKLQQTPQALHAETLASEGEHSGNRVYRLRHNKGADDATRPLRFIAVGCQGSGNQDQLNVAQLMDELCADPETRPDFVLILGDNVYDWGADSADDINIRKCFDDIYLRPTFTHLHHLPFFFILGNHDENLQNAVRAVRRNERGIVRGMHEVAHSYLEDEKYGADSKAFIYSRHVLQLNELPAYNMPRRYYSLIAGEVQIFCMDSNTYLKDYLDWIQHPDTINATNNQAAWLAVEFAKAKAENRKVVLAQHHPLYTPGKRAYHNDLGIYLDNADIIELQQQFGIPAAKDTPYNLFLTECLRRQKLVFDAILAAHDHNLSYFNNKHEPVTNYEICQITAGGGGGELQERVKFSEQKQMGCFLKKTGVSVVSHTPHADQLEFTIHTADRQHTLEFNSSAPEAIIHFDDQNPETAEIKKLFAVVEDAINEYLLFLGDRQDDQNGKFLLFTNNLTHGADGAERAHHLWAYIKQPYPASFAAIVSDIEKITAWTNPILEPARHSLITILDKKMMRAYGKTMEDFAYSKDNESIVAGLDIEMQVFK